MRDQTRSSWGRFAREVGSAVRYVLELLVVLLEEVIIVDGELGGQGSKGEVVEIC